MSAREKCPLHTGRFHTKLGKKFGLNTGCPLNILEPNIVYIFSQNNQEASGIEEEQQSVNVQDWVANNNN